MFVVKYRKIFYFVSSFLVLLSILAVALWGLNAGIDFKGGSLIEFTYEKYGSNDFILPEASVLKEKILNLSNVKNLGDISIRKSGDNGYIIRSRVLSEAERQSILKALDLEGSIVSEKRFSSIGPILGKEALLKSLWSIILVLLGIIVFITFAFRQVSWPVASWKYGLISILALIHDIIIPTGVFAFLGHFYDVEIDVLFVTAVLVILGFSVHDTIVVFDRTRENLRLSKMTGAGKKAFEEIVGESVTETLVRSINTSLTTLFSLLALYFVGPESTKWFALALILGVIVGTYSSIFIASPLLVSFEKWQSSRR
jgi:preprotein translocase subunit SecF